MNLSNAWNAILGAGIFWLSKNLYKQCGHDLFWGFSFLSDEHIWLLLLLNPWKSYLKRHPTTTVIRQLRFALKHWTKFKNTKIVLWPDLMVDLELHFRKKIVTYQLSVIGFGPTKSQSVSFVQLIRQFGVQRNTIFGLQPCFVQIPSRLRSI